MKKLNLQELSVKSFVTLSNDKQSPIQGGYPPPYTPGTDKHPTDYYC